MNNTFGWYSLICGVPKVAFPTPHQETSGKVSGYLCFHWSRWKNVSPGARHLHSESNNLNLCSCICLFNIFSLMHIKKQPVIFFFPVRWSQRKDPPSQLLFYSFLMNEMLKHNAHHEQKNNSIFFLPLTMHVIPAWIIMINYIYKFFRLHNPFHKYTYCSSFPQHKYFNIFTATARSFPVLFESATLKPMMLNRRIICPHFVFLF